MSSIFLFEKGLGAFLKGCWRFWLNGGPLIFLFQNRRGGEVSGNNALEIIVHDTWFMLLVVIPIALRILENWHLFIFYDEAFVSPLQNSWYKVVLRPRIPSHDKLIRLILVYSSAPSPRKREVSFLL